MRSSTSASNEGAFFGRAIACLAITFATTFGLAALAGRYYHPQSLTPDSRRVAASDHLVALLGNSRFEAGIDLALLAQTLSRPGQRVDVELFSGGGWDALHYYQLALLARDVLRPGRDVVVMEIAADDVNDDNAGNRLGSLRPEVARAMLALPDEPLETRLDIGAGLAALYRYRGSIQGIVLAPRLERWATRIGGLLAQLGLVGLPPREPPFHLVMAPGSLTRIEQVEGDQNACRLAMRRVYTGHLDGLKVGGFKWSAIERAVQALRERGIAVVLVQTPMSQWMRDWLARTPGGASFTACMGRLRAGGVTIEDQWPPAMNAADRFWDDTHMNVAAGVEFTRALAERIRSTQGW